MSKKSGKSPLHASGPIRPKAPAGIGYHSGRAIHGNASVKTTERKMAPPKSRKRAK
jgi:hypothetical protein